MRTLFILATALLLSSSVFAQSQVGNDSIVVAVHPQYNKVSGLHKAFWGKNYRPLWAEPVKMKVFYLGKEKGGLAITGLGGGNQTRSLQLKDSAGHEYVLRTVQKYPGRALPKIKQKTIFENVLQDEVSTSHPYSALCVPPMADALDIPHTHPMIVYLPDDPALGKYRKEFANQVFLFEEKEPLDGSKTEKTEKLQKKIQANNDYRANEQLLLRARLLDMIMGDWDRHGDQWRWQPAADTVKGKVFEPSPRDRDKVFYTTSGVFLWLIDKENPQLQPYHHKIKQPGFWNFNARFFDLYFLTGLDEHQWETEIDYVQTHLTDQVIVNAVKQLPPNIYALSGKRLTATLIARRNNLKNYGLEYYRFLARNVDVAASDKAEKFTIIEQPDGKISVSINKFKGQTLGGLIYQRTFDPAETREIRLYGMGGKDNFEVQGNVGSKIKLRLVGGDDEDRFTVDPQLHNKSKVLIYDRSDQKNQLPSGADARVETSRDTTVNRYDKESFKYNISQPFVTLGYSVEDGVRLIGGYKIETHGFRKEPYATQQELQVGYTLSRGSFIIEYKGDFKKVIGNNGIRADILSRGPKNVNNFFGLGNDVPFPNSGTHNFNFYRNRYDIVNADIRLYHQYGKWELNGGLLAQYYNSSATNNQNLFFSEYNASHPDLNLFATKYYAGAVLGLVLDTRNSSKYPTHGVYWNTNIKGYTGLNIDKHTNGQILSAFCFYLNPGKDSVFVIADRIGVGAYAGNGEFFQQMNLGGPLSLQGYHTSRFIGNKIAYNNLEFRLRLFQWRNYLFPATWGLVGFNDTGRVWLPGENSNTVHDTYGGGLFVMPVNAFVLQAVVGNSPDGALLYLSSGFRF